MLLFTFEKNNFLCKMREKNNLSRGKIPAPPGYQMVRPLSHRWCQGTSLKCPTEIPPFRTLPSGIPPTGISPFRTPPTGIPPTEIPPFRTPPSGIPPTGIPPFRTPPTGIPPTGIPPFRTPPSGIPPTGIPPFRTPPSGIPPTGIPPSGMTPSQVYIWKCVLVSVWFITCYLYSLLLQY